jgi:hypothetical protein
MKLTVAFGARSLPAMRSASRSTSAACVREARRQACMRTSRCENHPFGRGAGMTQWIAQHPGEPSPTSGPSMIL